LFGFSSINFRSVRRMKFIFDGRIQERRLILTTQWHEVDAPDCKTVGSKVISLRHVFVCNTGAWVCMNANINCQFALIKSTSPGQTIKSSFSVNHFVTWWVRVGGYLERRPTVSKLRGINAHWVGHSWPIFKPRIL
jgi:hypothetical protein